MRVPLLARRDRRRRHRELSRARPPSSVLVIPIEFDLHDRQATSTAISFHRLVLPPPGHVATEADLILDQAWPDGITRIINPAHCDGLVAIATATDRVFVCNPATQEFVALPLGSHNAELDSGMAKAVPVALGFDQWRNSYVVARYFYRTNGEMTSDETTGEWYHNIGHEVFTLGGGSWEFTEDPPHAIGDHQGPICTRRGFYWHSDDDGHDEPRLMRFGLQDRKFEVVARPPTSWSMFDGMANLDGKLCYVHAVAEASFHVWMAAADGPGPNLEWSLLCRVDLPDPEPEFIYNFMPVHVADDGDTLVASAGITLYRCNLKNGSMEKVVDMQHRLQYRRSDGSKYKCRPHDSIDGIMPYFETLISPRTCNY